MDRLLENTIKSAMSKIGSDPNGWDKPMNEQETREFMKFNNSDRKIETVYLGPDNDRDKV